MNNLAYKLIQNCEKIPDKICLIQKDKKVTYIELHNMVSNFKTYLESTGIKKGQKVLVLVPMSIELYVTLLSVWSIGAIPCFMDAGFIKNGMKKNDFDDIDAVVGNLKYILYSNINKNLKKLKIKINVSKISKLVFNKKLEICEVDKEFPGILTYTSGTTGKPKIASRTHEFLAYQGEVLKDTINYENTDIEISTLPIFTLSNINIGITTIIANGNFSNLGESNPQKIVTQILENNVNRVMAAPGLLNVIANYCIARNIKLTKVKKTFTGGGAVFIDFIKKLKMVFPNSDIITIYGSTEAEPIAKLNVNDISVEDLKKIENGHGILAGNIVGVEECKIIKTDVIEIGNLNADGFKELQTDTIRRNSSNRKKCFKRIC